MTVLQPTALVPTKSFCFHSAASALTEDGRSNTLSPCTMLLPTKPRAAHVQGWRCQGGTHPSYGSMTKLLLDCWPLLMWAPSGGCCLAGAACWSVPLEPYPAGWYSVCRQSQWPPSRSYCKDPHPGARPPSAAGTQRGWGALVRRLRA